MSISRMYMFTLILASCMLWFARPCWSGAVLKPNGADAMPVFTRSVTARAEISGQFATTTLVMVFQNESEDDIEADFIYTLPSGAVATYFAYWAGDEKVEAKILEKKEAARIYEHLTTYSRDPALVELRGKNTFRARISPVPANQDLKVEIRYVQTLASDGDSVRYTVPIGPAIDKQSDPLESVDAVVHVKDDGRIRSLSNNYGVPVTNESGAYNINIKGKNYRPIKDLSVRILRRHNPLRAELCAEPESGHFSLALTPDHSLKHPRVRISGVAATLIAPRRIPDVRAGHAVVVSGRYKYGGKALVTLSGQSSSGRKSYSVPIEFGKASCSGIAPKLWAAAHMNDLGGKRSNRKSVVTLSFRYGLPSRYTSWLAVPKAETLSLKLEAIQPQLYSLAHQMAEMFSDGRQDTPVYQNLQSQYDNLRKPFDAEMTTRFLTSELWQKRSETVDKIVVLRCGEKPDAAAEAALRDRAERISKEVLRLAPNDRMNSLDEEIALGEQLRRERECFGLVQKLLKLTTDGNPLSKEAKDVRAQYMSIREHLPADSYLVEHDIYTERVSNLIHMWASSIVAERHNPIPDKSVLMEAQKKIDALSSILGHTPDEEFKKAENEWVLIRCRSEAHDYASSVAQGEMKEADTHLRLFEKFSKTADVKESREMIASMLQIEYSGIVYEYWTASQDRATRPAELKRLYRNVSRLATMTGNSLEESLKEYDARPVVDRMYDSANKLISELGRKHPLRSRVERLRKDTGKTASELKSILSNHRLTNEADSYNAAADQSIGAWLEEQRIKAQVQKGSAGEQELEKASKSRQEAQDKLQATLYYIRSSVRGGDPLISVDAPEDALRVIALLPDGDVKTLAWNPKSRKWEARFDVPTGTPDGDYVVQVIVMLSDGTRKFSSVSFKVDNTPPTGSATAILSDGDRSSLRLEIKPSEEVARIVAILPWGERVELHKSDDSSLFRTIIRLPAAAGIGKIEFILTDNAHNRGSVFVSPEAR